MSDVRSHDGVRSERLTAYLDGELSPEERVAVDRDVAADPVVAAELASLRAVTQYLHAFGETQAPPGFVGAVLRAVADEPMARPRWWQWRPLGLRLEAIGVVAVAALVVAVSLTSPRDVAVVSQGGPRAQVAARRPPQEDDGAALGRRAVAAPVDQAKAPLDRPLVVEGQGAVASAEGAVTGGPVGTMADGDVPGSVETTGAATAPTATGSSSSDLYGVSYRYEVVVQDDQVVAQLRALARDHRGTVAAHVPVGESAPWLGTYTVSLPPAQVRDFGRALGELGAVRAIPDERMFSGAMVAVQVRLTTTSARDVNAAPR